MPKHSTRKGSKIQYESYDDEDQIMSDSPDVASKSAARAGPAGAARSEDGASLAMYFDMSDDETEIGTSSIDDKSYSLAYQKSMLLSSNGSVAKKTVPGHKPIFGFFLGANAQTASKTPAHNDDKSDFKPDKDLRATYPAEGIEGKDADDFLTSAVTPAIEEAPSLLSMASPLDDDFDIDSIDAVYRDHVKSEQDQFAKNENTLDKLDETATFLHHFDAFHADDFKHLSSCGIDEEDSVDCFACDVEYCRDALVGMEAKAYRLYHRESYQGDAAFNVDEYFADDNSPVYEIIAEKRLEYLDILDQDGDAVMSEGQALAARQQLYQRAPGSLSTISKPSVVIKLFNNYFSIESYNDSDMTAQVAMLPYNNTTRSFLREVASGRLVPDILEEFHEIPSLPFYNGCLAIQVLDLTYYGANLAYIRAKRGGTTGGNSSSFALSSDQKIILKPVPEFLYQDVNDFLYMNFPELAANDDDRLAVMYQVLHASNKTVCLDPDTRVGLALNMYHYNDSSKEIFRRKKTRLVVPENAIVPSTMSVTAEYLSGSIGSSLAGVSYLQSVAASVSPSASPALQQQYYPGAYQRSKKFDHTLLNFIIQSGWKSALQRVEQRGESKKRKIKKAKKKIADYQLGAAQNIEIIPDPSVFLAKTATFMHNNKMFNLHRTLYFYAVNDKNRIWKVDIYPAYPKRYDALLQPANEYPSRWPIGSKHAADLYAKRLKDMFISNSKTKLTLDSEIDMYHLYMQQAAAAAAAANGYAVPGQQIIQGYVQGYTYLQLPVAQLAAGMPANYTNAAMLAAVQQQQLNYLRAAAAAQQMAAAGAIPYSALAARQSAEAIKAAQQAAALYAYRASMVSPANGGMQVPRPATAAAPNPNANAIATAAHALLAYFQQGTLREFTPQQMQIIAALPNGVQILQHVQAKRAQALAQQQYQQQANQGLQPGP